MTHPTLLSKGEPGLPGLRGPEGAQGIGTQGEKVCFSCISLHSCIFIMTTMLIR